MDAIGNFVARFARSREEELSLDDYLLECRRNPLAYATAAERMLTAIGEPQILDTRNEPRLSRIFANKLIKIYPAFSEFFGMEEVIEQVVSYFRHAAQGLEERKQILYLLGPVGGGKSSLAERLKYQCIDLPQWAAGDLFPDDAVHADSEPARVHASCHRLSCITPTFLHARLK